MIILSRKSRFYINYASYTENVKIASYYLIPSFIVFQFLFIHFYFSSLLCNMSLPGDDVLFLLATFLFVVFCLLSLFSEIVPGLISFGSVFLVTTAGFVAD